MNKENQNRLDTYIEKVKERAQNFLGYPVSIDFDYSELYPLLKYPLNNLGDPLIESTYDLNSRSIEREVVQFFAELFKAPKDNFWGYVTNGGSEGNLYALYVARELYPTGMVYYSEATHYSVQKNISLLGMPSILIRAQENGEIDYEDLKDAVHMHRDRPAIVIANIGTTMTEAKDDISQIKKALKNSAIRSHYIHVDAALAGTYLALLEKEPKFDFENGADSVAISGHKFIGSPIPCGVVVVKKNYKDRIGQAIPYIGTLDTTITGSRNGHSPVFLWYAIKKFGLEGLKERAQICLEVAEYTETKMKEKGIAAWRNPNAITVVFPKPSQEVCVKWQLASDSGLSHIICMPGVTKEKIDDFLKDL
ncbi:MAG: histidine decarboxylase [Pseudomonadota bacterium]